VVDVREDILARLLVVVAGIPNIKSAQRNNTEIPEDLLPAALVFDGDEDSNGASDIASGRPGRRTYVVQMTPEIVIVQQVDEVGSELTTLRRELIKRVVNDTELNGLAGTNGAIRYLGCQTDLGWGRSLQGALRAQFVFKYALKIEDL
jgi:hypothetical protein